MSGGFNQDSVSSVPPVLAPTSDVEPIDPKSTTISVLPVAFPVPEILIAVGQRPLPSDGLKVFRSPDPNV